ncbi:spore germination protein GerW family protein [Halorussus salinisoli]|uniref:spore germination protein GerW family protein n=1 Tax=Halorussus salinisoli TaxID=2558242 RepID=UPI0014859A1C
MFAVEPLDWRKQRAHTDRVHRGATPAERQRPFGVRRLDRALREDIVSVARVAYGFGGGYGRGGTDDERTTEGEVTGQGSRGDGSGGGGGATARPVGALEISDDGTRFVRFEERKRSLALLVIVLAVGMLVGRLSNLDR